ncbi:S8 family serine peptidase [Bdellovibrio svalbardensis]|uniref:S8 family serine peptidase n=1 Tax=Bdellovibrio svalbardensis TaxID=2972972 RepID=A0ABT6DJH5_9BACT|nr:S8 family serine peptidase [Bdellovibrio svalbardensis]MDG0816001.1 S8 family serine peptidase [Bdellovibrio svalbardensis]
MQRNKKLRILIALFSMFAATSVMFTNCSEMGFAVLASNTGDPFYSYSWHLQNTGQKVFASNAGTSGVDMNLQQTWAQGYTGKGVIIQVSDTGVEDIHEDLHGNFLYGGGSKDYTLSSPYLSNASAPRSSSDNHGTSVAGLIAAVADNGVGSRGVAPKASLTSANIISSVVTHTNYSKILDQAQGSFDISNMSWGADQNYIDDDYGGYASAYEAQLKYGVTNQRNGKGAIYVKAAGNDYQVQCYGSSSSMCLGNSNFDRDDANPYQIVVAALDSSGSSASYSSPGANLWISSYGGEHGSDSPAMFTTDRSGCGNGESISSASTSVLFEKGQKGNTSCNYTATFNGTSSAAPTLAGAVALMLEAKPSLTWRDVKYILAKTARSGTETGNYTHPYQISLPVGYNWEQKWITNGAGFKFHNWYGFGAVNVDAAVAMAKTYSSALGTYHETTWFSSGTVNAAIPDYTAAGASNAIAVGSDNVKIEAVRIKLQVTHAAISQLAIELTSPSGVKSILVNAVNALTNQANYSGGEVLLSNAFYGENSTGTWTIRVVDAQSGTTGTLVNWSINFVGGQ